MCKHIAAVLYGVGARLDENPELLFRLRAVDETELLSELTSVRLKNEQIQLVALEVVVEFVFASGNRLREQHFFKERH